MVEVDLLDFVETFKRLAKQALGKHAGEPATGGFARWKHVVIHGFRREEEHNFRETENRLEYMGEIREVLELEKGDVPDYTTLNKSFDRFKMWVWRALLRIRRSNTRSPDTLPSTARSSTAATPLRTISADRTVRSKR